jgi:hypothetical protein
MPLTLRVVPLKLTVNESALAAGTVAMTIANPSITNQDLFMVSSKNADIAGN